MIQACRLAERALGQTWPNPAVGCVIVNPKDNLIVGRGWTQKTGRPHAETQALDMAGAQAKDSWVFVSLEPCCHHGKTPPCTDALIKAGVKRVYVATLDPDPRVAGQGILALKNAGIEVEIGLQHDWAQAINQGFFLKILENRPLVSLKVATSMDGRIALENGQSQWLTGPQTRDHVHRQRHQYDAIMVGMGTVLADDPQLTCRLPGVDHQPVRIVVSHKNKLPLTSRLVDTIQTAPLWWLCPDDLSQEDLQFYHQAGVKIFTLPVTESGLFDLKLVLKILAQQGLTRLMVEGGQRLLTSFMQQDLVDQLIWYRSPHLIGGDGLAAFDALGYTSLEQALNFTRTDSYSIGPDQVDFYQRKT